MSSDTDLSIQPDTLQQQPPLMEKRRNSSWKTFSILLIIVNLPVVGLIIAVLISDWPWWDNGLDYMLAGFIQSFMALSPYLISLAIIDFIAVRSHIKNKNQNPIKKQTPPWKVFFISLLVINIIFFSYAGWALGQSAGGVALIVIVPIALILLLIDSIAILSYIYIHLPNGRAKVIFYTTLVSILLGLLALSIFYSAYP